MKWPFLLLACLLTGIAPSASALPPLPPREDLRQQLVAFFGALPKRLPVEDMSAFAPHVSADVKVYQAGELAFSNREQWFDYLDSFGPSRADGPQGITISREAFYATHDGDIVVLEFWWPIPPKGKEGQISYHENYNLRLVSYRLENGTLTRIDYGKGMRRYDQWLKEDASSVPRSR